MSPDDPFVKRMAQILVVFVFACVAAVIVTGIVKLVS